MILTVVWTTKAYSAQLVALYLLAMKFAWAKKSVDEASYMTLLDALKDLPGQIEGLLKDKEQIQHFANR